MIIRLICLMELFPPLLDTFSSAGSHFLVAAPKIMPHTVGPSGYHRIVLTMSNRVVSDIHISITAPHSDHAWSSQVVLKARTVDVFDVPRRFLSEVTFGKKGSYQLNGTGVFSLVVVLSKDRTSMATFQAVPVASWGRRYVAVTLFHYPSLQVISSADNNSIHAVVSVRWDTGHGTTAPTVSYDGKDFSGGALDFVLRRCEAFSISFCQEKFRYDITLVGSVIEGLEPIGLVSGDCESTTNTSDCVSSSLSFLGETYDIGAEMMLPHEAMGTEFIAVAPRNRRPDGFFMIVTGEGHTVVNASGDTEGGVRTIKLEAPGDSNTDLEADRNRKVVSSKRIHVVVVTRSACFRYPPMFTGNGDVAFAIIIPNRLFDAEYIWTPPSIVIHNFALIVVEKDHAEFIYLDHSPLAERVHWSEVNGDARFMVGIVAVSKRNHSIASTHYFKFGCYLYGLGPGLQYIHAAGFKGCMPSVDVMVAGDGVDNDCDDYVDEEIPNGQDDDNDTRVDEDTHGAQGTPGHWGSWTPWACNPDCINMVLVMTRACDDPPPRGGGPDCPGPRNQTHNTPCFADIGCAPLECHNFTWGDDCEHSCANCRDRCHPLTGECTHCKEGFKYPEGSCVKPCDYNEYGPGCKQSCAEKCGADCIDRVTGECPDVRSFHLLWVLWFAVISVVMLMSCQRKKEGIGAEIE